MLYSVITMLTPIREYLDERKTCALWLINVEYFFSRFHSDENYIKYGTPVKLSYCKIGPTINKIVPCMKQNVQNEIFIFYFLYNLVNTKIYMNFGELTKTNYSFITLITCFD